MSITSLQPWNVLPIEMKLSVVDLLDLNDVRSFSKVNREAYSLSVPAMWRHIDIKSYDALRSYLSHVPPSYHTFIRHLTVCTKPSSNSIFPNADALKSATCSLVDLLAHCSQVEQLTLSLDTSLTEAVIPCFQRLTALTDLSITHCGDEQLAPL